MSVPRFTFSRWLLAIAGVAGLLTRATGAVEIRFGTDSDQQLVAAIEVGHVSIGPRARLPVRLEHYVASTLEGDISRFTVTPLESYLVGAGGSHYRWRSPLGGTLILPRPPLGFYAQDDLSLTIADGESTVRLADRTALSYRNGLLFRLVLPGGAALRCETSGRRLVSLRRNDDVLLASELREGTLVLRGHDVKGGPALFRFRLNAHGQIVAFAAPSGSGRILYGSDGLLSRIETKGRTVDFRSSPVPWWDYVRLQRGLRRAWRTSASNES